ncbi:hypothetical protein F2981_05580 [Sinorhizobium meliloti]|nr:hypothetical protein [Sinorhizobium meliloti]
MPGKDVPHQEQLFDYGCATPRPTTTRSAPAGWGPTRGVSTGVRVRGIEGLRVCGQLGDAAGPVLQHQRPDDQ